MSINSNLWHPSTIQETYGLQPKGAQGVLTYKLWVINANKGEFSFEEYSQ